MHFSKVRSSRLPPSISLTVFAFIVLLMGFFTACSASKHSGASTSTPVVTTAFDSSERITAALQPQPTESSQTIELMARGDIWLIPFWNDFGLSVARDRKLVFMTNYFPKEGTPVRNTPIAIPESAVHKLAGLLFLNYTLKDEVQQELALLTQQIPASIGEGVWKDLPTDTFNYDFSYIQSHTFAAFNSQQNLARPARQK